MRVYLGSDHAGFELKAHLLEQLNSWGHETIDVGPKEFNPTDDYPPYCIDVARRVSIDESSLGVVIGSSGNGEQMAANKVTGVRAALAWNADTARLAREHNDAQVVSIGARMHTAEQATELVQIFLDTPFSGEARHQRRIDMLLQYEENQTLPELPER